MLGRLFAAILAITLLAPFAAHSQIAPKPPKRIALVIGQNAYPGGGAAVKGLPVLYNSRNDAEKIAALLGKHGIEVIACDGGVDGVRPGGSDPRSANPPGCYDLDEAGLNAAIGRFEARAKGADLALVFYAGHGMDTHQGNILAPVDATVDCTSGDVRRSVTVERLLKAADGARDKLIILDACRDNPLGAICPGLQGRKLPFARIEPGARQNFLLVTSAQFGAEAHDGPPGTHSPFATALLAALDKSPNVYFDQVLNAVARATYEAVHALKGKDVLQVPGRVVGGAAPADCLAGKDCIGDNRMAALRQDVEKLGAEAQAAQADAAGVRAILADEEGRRGKPYTTEERTKRVAEIGQSLTSIASSAEPKVKEAGRLLNAGRVAEGRAKLDEALDDDEKAAADIERMAAERRKTAARNARDAARLAVGSDVAKALGYYARATRNDPSDAQTWIDYGEVAVEAGRLAVAKSAFEQAALKARDGKQPLHQSKANYRIGDVLREQGNLRSARRSYETAFAIIEPLAKSDSGNASWQRDLSVSQEKIGDVLRSQGNLPEAMIAFNASLAIRDRLAKSDPGNAGWQRDVYLGLFRVATVKIDQGDMPAALAELRRGHEIIDRLAKSDPGNVGWQRDLSVSYIKIGDVLSEQGNLADALKAFNAALAISDRLAKSDPGNAGWQRDLSASQQRIGNVLSEQGNLAEALKAFNGSLAISDRLAKSDPGNAGWQRDLFVSHTRIGHVLSEQGNLPDALKAFQASLAISDRLAKSDPGNAGWQRDLSSSHNRIGRVIERQGDRPQALVHARDSLAIDERLSARDPTNVTWQKDVQGSRARMRQLEGK